MKPLYSTDRARIYEGDCRELLQSPSFKANLIFIDPPYFLSSQTKGVFRHGRSESLSKGVWDITQGYAEDRAFHMSYLGRLKDVLSETGSVWLCGTYHNIYTCGDCISSLGYRILNDIIWFKPNACPNMSRRCFTASHETLLWFTRKENKDYYFNYDSAKAYHSKQDILKNTGKQMRSVWYIPKTSEAERDSLIGLRHPTQKSYELLKRIVLLTSKEDDIVFDPFMGSGVLGIVCKDLRRRYIGIDKNSEYVHNIVNVLRKKDRVKNGPWAN